ncbi:hypothetical protein THRCLA_07106 [Thraustotheca clavata]|uniref:Uncharacterized protein n=1 Tax=Thraustotheca clavata TaxID=74557 RepID=A0A1V9ZGD4_9STRA|nr:hypothetical protein THRCLA_07106 [Thraustotheca clavata]
MEYPNLAAELRLRAVATRGVVEKWPPRRAKTAQESRKIMTKPRVIKSVEAQLKLHREEEISSVQEIELRSRMQTAGKPEKSLTKSRSQILKSSSNLVIENNNAATMLVSSASTPALNSMRPFTTAPMVEPTATPLQQLFPISCKPRARFARRQIHLPTVNPRWQPPKVGFGLDLPLNYEDEREQEPQDQGEGCFLTEIDVPTHYIFIAEKLALASYQLYVIGDLTSAYSTLQLVLRQALSIKDIALQSLVYHHLGTAKKEMGDFTTSIELQTQCVRLAESILHSKLQGRGLKGLGVAFVCTEQYSRAFDCHVKCLRIAQTERDFDLEGRSHANLGNVCSAQGQMDRSIASHLKDLELAVMIDSHSGQARAHHNLALIYKKINNPTKQNYHESMCAHFGTQPYLRDMHHHANDIVGNIYYQIDSNAVAKKLGDFLLTLPPKK